MTRITSQQQVSLPLSSSDLALDVGAPAPQLAPEQQAALRAQQAAELRATLDNLHQLAAQPDLAAQRALGAGERGLPPSAYDGSKGGVLNLLAQPTPPLARGGDVPRAGAEYPAATASMLEQMYGPQAAMQMLQLELAMVRMEMALMAAMQGGSLEQVQGFLRDPSPQGQALAAQIQALGQLLRSGDFDLDDVEQRLSAGRQQFADYAARQSGMDPALVQRMGEQELGVEPRAGTRPPVDDSGVRNATGTRFPPFSDEARALFRQAARKAGVPESWADSAGLHNILKRESNGQVGRPNYTYGSRAKDPSQWASIHQELKSGRISAKSSATGLGQLLLRNVDRYYPSGRAGIGDPVEEAAGMLAYIKDRYGSPERAWALYGKLHEGY